MARPAIYVRRIDGTDHRAAGIHMRGHVERLGLHWLNGVIFRFGRYGSPRARVVVVRTGLWL